VVSDLKRLRHHQRLREEMSQIEQQAEEEGLILLGLEHGTSVDRTVSVSLYDKIMFAIQSARNQPLEPMPADIPGIGPHEATARAVVDYAYALPQDVPVEQLTEAQRVFTVPVDDRLAILVARVMRIQPFTEENYQRDAEGNRLQAILASEEFEGGDTVSEAFSFDVMKARHHLVTIADEAEDKPPVPAPPPSDLWREDPP
jgi:hypothetical protein